MASGIDEHEYASNNWNDDPDRTRCHRVRFRDSGQADDFMEMCYVDNTPMPTISNHGVAKNGPKSRDVANSRKGLGIGH